MVELIELLGVALGKRTELEAPFTEEQWDAVYDEAKRQAVLGVAYKSVEILPDEQKPSRRLKVQWALAAERIAQRNGVMDNHTREITKAMSALGPKSCVLKGQGVATLYPWPESRQSGDVDLWVEGGHGALIPLLKRNWKVGDVFYHHADIKAFTDGTGLEVHFLPSWMNSPFGNRKLLKWFDAQAPAQFENYFLDKGFSMPTIEFNLVYSMIHIYRHTLHEGIGLRQLMDYYFILQHSSSEERQAAVKMFKSLHMTKFAAAVMYALKKFFDIEDKLLLCRPDKKLGSIFLREVSLSGNFGQSDVRNKGMDSKNILVRAILKMRRLLRFIHIAPSEVLWAPAFKAWQWCWRFKNHYC